jgi:biofilm PGA synthesis N-glycosyltransferase PgaC
MSTTLQHLWHSALNFVFYYPLFMSYLWMMGALIFYWKERKEPPYQQPAELDVYPMVAVLIPCFNEGDNAEETISHALSLDYPNFEVIAINDGSSDNTAKCLTVWLNDLKSYVWFIWRKIKAKLWLYKQVAY